MKRSLCFLLLNLTVGTLLAQNADPRDRNAVNNPTSPPASTGSTGMMADSPVAFPDKGALPAIEAPDLPFATYPVEKDYLLFASPCRSLAQIARLQAAMPSGQFVAPMQDWTHLARTRARLEAGGEFHLLALGDSIVNDTMRSGWIAKLQQAYPQAKIRATVYVRGGGGCRHYREEGRIGKYLVPLKPDLVLIGGISQGLDLQPLREVIGQIRSALPDCEFVLATGVFGTVDPRDDAAMAKAPHSATSSYGSLLQGLATELDCAYLDLTRPWMEYIRSSGQHPHRFYRDRVHANEYGEQILAKILLSWWTAPGSGSAIR